MAATAATDIEHTKRRGTMTAAALDRTKRCGTTIRQAAAAATTTVVHWRSLGSNRHGRLRC
jgi:hypothetical protein